MKILVAADISPNSIAIVEFLKVWLKGSQVQAQMTILHITEPELDYAESAPSHETAPNSMSKEELKELFHPLESLCELNYVITNEEFGDSILKRSENVDMIVMGRRKRDQLQEMLLGSLSQFILHRATCPLLIVPEPDRAIAPVSVPNPETPVISGEALARLKVLICMAKADGILNESEKVQLRSSARVFARGMMWDHLLDESIDLSAELAQITTPVEQELTYYTAYRLMAAKAEPHPSEKNIVEQIKDTFNLDAATIEQLHELVNQSYTIQGDRAIQPIKDVQQRAEVIDQKILYGAIATAVLGAFPSPLLSTYTESVALDIQFALISEVGGLWGYTDLESQSLFEGIVGSLGFVSAWLTAIDIAKLLPNLGTNLGASDAFMATWAIGKTMNAYCESDRKLSSSAMRQMFKQSRKEGEAIYRKNEWAIVEQQNSHKFQIKKLTEDLRARKLALDDYKRLVRQQLFSIHR
ncbi:MAG: universal stress protein [Microcoleus sp. PH2017_10_PVI_O_A]|uniref:universal stress protein n=1 Tax=unclassified Microcoleus TaxID=2642155 RepID=UPI001D938DDE|nr:MULTISPECIES: universal stress protein [unclassified Microcoleus]TAE83115.1 MAG: hypothetical protein EAZ83_09765 [Oscillatoriales cyanobacterium]MCC3406366.1 universal stress protein [Microcoleus sp. PH2017_10_PVI_O_A]MCC3460351.1 universal stress protein [Microcoleus sp. PH2017_11_PCY_U_A]MCC3478883.1 universal stress protein [Microcoleus sp. PH2017_12_PCY_D_A]MCC3559818.1 universal stress protein [Microcoleus sp. PH2017_27_LUM_O_A]